MCSFWLIDVTLGSLSFFFPSSAFFLRQRSGFFVVGCVEGCSVETLTAGKRNYFTPLELFTLERLSVLHPLKPAD